LPRWLLSLPVFEAAAQQNVPAAPAQEPGCAPSGPRRSARVSQARSGKLHRLVAHQGDRQRLSSGQLGLMTTPHLAGAGHSEDSGRRREQGRRSGGRQDRQAEAWAAIQFFALPDGKHIMPATRFFPLASTPMRRIARGAAAGRRSLSRLGLEGSGDRRVCRLPVPALQGSAGQHGQAGGGFPQGRIVFQNYPLPQHKAAAGAAAYGVCVAKQGGSTPSSPSRSRL
jgi:hypothetical protein